MGIKVGINGFGRIGRNVLRSALGDDNIDFVAVNDLTDTRTLAHLLKYDSIMGNLEQEITADADTINVNGESFKVFSENDPAAIDWASSGQDSCCWRASRHCCGRSTAASSCRRSEKPNSRSRRT